MSTLVSLLLVVAAYLIGAVPWGFVLGKLNGIDVRTQGSGGTGTTNTLRLLGWKIAATVFVLDFLKGLVPVLVARWLDAPTWVVAAVGVATVVGHCWPVYIGFKGGKGMATSGGAALGLAWWLLVLLPPMIGIVYLTRYVSLASICAAVAGPLILIVASSLGYLPWSWTIATCCMGAIIVWQHRSNIQRLLNGTERKFGTHEAPSTA
ncbi:MAG TPA: glycerol-3-phosphate 1-O-acyltransferase PlsY [Thermomicrobiales bacterium]|nr:glycerol-3-phosphate 1-O-acyltransferase PlsY [Thermomicrobiales bacterium]